MHRRTAGIAALALALMLGLVAAQPAAAAAGPRRTDRVTTAWSVPTPAALWRAVATWLGLDHAQAKSNSTTNTVERGFGIDPNGFSIETSTPGTTAGGAN
jgi:ABC-type sugar transport system substrate-binding protein